MSDYSLLVKTRRYAGARQPFCLGRESHGTKLRPQMPACFGIFQDAQCGRGRLGGQPRRTTAILVAPAMEDFWSVLHPGFS